MSARKQGARYMRTFIVRDMNRRRDIVLTVILTLTGLSHGLRSMEDLEEDVEDNVPVELEEGLVVTVLKRPAKCLREAAVGEEIVKAQDSLTVLDDSLSKEAKEVEKSMKDMSENIKLNELKTWSQESRKVGNLHS